MLKGTGLYSRILCNMKLNNMTCLPNLHFMDFPNLIIANNFEGTIESTNMNGKY